MVYPIACSKGSALVLCTAWLGLIALPLSLRADAWTQEQGHGQVILTTSYFDTSEAFDASGKAQHFDFAGAFRQVLVNPYLEYGLTSRTTLVVNAFVPFLTFSNQYGAQSSAGLGDVETGIRRRLNSLESPMPISVQLTVMFPTYPADRNPPPGNHQVDVESRFMLGRGIDLGGHHAFWSTGAAFRFRTGAPADQFRSDATFGVDLTRRFMVMAQYFGITGMRNGQPFELGDNPNAQSDYDLYKGQLSLVTRVRGKSRIQIGWNDTLIGRNTGRGQTYLISFWQDF